MYIVESMGTMVNNFLRHFSSLMIFSRFLFHFSSFLISELFTFSNAIIIEVDSIRKGAPLLNFWFYQKTASNLDVHKQRRPILPILWPPSLPLCCLFTKWIPTFLGSGKSKKISLAIGILRPASENVLLDQPLLYKTLIVSWHLRK